MTFRLAHISDTHLSACKPYFVANFCRVGEHLLRAKPDLVLNTGDMALDGANTESDLSEAKRLHDDLSLPTAYTPGNHDVGESPNVPGNTQAHLTDDRREVFLRYFGHDFWMRDIPGWRLIAVNCQLLDSALDAAAVQLDFVADAVSTCAGQSLALFIHKPLFDISASENAVTGRFVTPKARRGLMDALGGRKPSLVASGHVHQYRSTLVDGIHCVWAPSTAFILPDAKQPLYGEKKVGYVEHAFERDGSHRSVFKPVTGLTLLNIEDFPNAYEGWRLAPPPSVH